MSAKSRAFYAVLIALLAVCALFYIRHGLIELTSQRSHTKAVDLRINWLEFRAVAQRSNPYVNPLNNNRSSPYPPYAFLVNGLFYWPPWPAAKWYFGALTLACMLLCASWAAQSRPEAEPIQRLLLFFAVVGCSVISTIVGLGQNTTIYVVLLVACMLLLQADRQILAGIALAIATSKINIAAPFFIPLLIQKKWTAVAAAIGYMVLATAIVCWWIHFSPQQIFHLWLGAAKANFGQGYTFSTLLEFCHVPPQISTTLAAVMVLSGAVVLGYLARHASWQTQFAVACVAGRLWTYHRIYDNFMLIFLVVSLLSLCFVPRPRPMHLAITAAVCLIFWLPPHLIDHPPVWVLSMLLWIGGAIIMAINRPEPNQPAATSAPLAPAQHA